MVIIVNVTINTHFQKLTQSALNTTSFAVDIQRLHTTDELHRWRDLKYRI